MKVCVPLLVICDLFIISMTLAIYLDDDAHLGTIEIHNVRSNPMLAPELQSEKLPVRSFDQSRSSGPVMFDRNCRFRPRYLACPRLVLGTLPLLASPYKGRGKEKLFCCSQDAVPLLRKEGLGEVEDPMKTDQRSCQF